jgi:hypothetical protein
MHMFAFLVAETEAAIGAVGAAGAAGAEGAGAAVVITSICIFNSFIFFKPFY